jgi:hypothetical protein
VGFSWPFLEEMSNWTLGVGVVAALVGGVITRDPLFVAAVLAGVLADVAIVRTTVHKGLAAEASRSISPSIAGLFVGLRLAVKALILVVAYFSGDRQLFWGAVIGVVLFDTVLLVVGSIRAASTMFEAKER